MPQLMRRFSIFCLFVPLMLLMDSADAQQCPPNAHVTSITQEGNKRIINCACDDGYESRSGACVRVSGARPDPQCVQRAGQQLDRDIKIGCAREMGNCLAKNNITFSGSALSCVARCNTFVSCLPACGVSGTIATSVVLQCWDDITPCKEGALVRHKQAVAACQ